MLSQEEQIRIRRTVERTLGREISCSIIPAEEPDVYISCTKGAAAVGALDKTCFARALTLLAKELSGGKDTFVITQKPHFKTCGLALDVSRNGVMKPEKLKEYMDHMACMGVNSLMLYMEDVYEMKKYPYFGYMRGRYTLEELREIDDYGDSLGIEVIPNIQTLGHMEQYLRWSNTSEQVKAVRDTESVLLCGAEETYELLEEMISTMRRAFRSSRIHLNMDEALDVGFGRYLQKNGYRDRFAIMNGHLKRVTALCEKYGFSPIIASDMYFRLGSPSGEYYDKNWSIPQKALEEMPDVTLTYWDYYHFEEEEYNMMIRQHRQLSEKLLFMGGIWTWSGQLPSWSMTEKTMVPALRACCNHQVDQVIASVWGDDGCETNGFFALPGLALFSEFCYRGAECPMEEVYSMSEFVTGMPREAYRAMSAISEPFAEITDVPYNLYFGKALFYSDILLNLCGHIQLLEKLEPVYHKAEQTLKEQTKSGKWVGYEAFAHTLLGTLKEKAKLMYRLRTAYSERDGEYLKEAEYHILPDLMQRYQRLHRMAETLWKSTYKVFGWETLDARYAVAEERIGYAIRTLAEYRTGKIDAIAEMEFDFLDKTIIRKRVFNSYTSTSYGILQQG